MRVSSFCASPVLALALVGCRSGSQVVPVVATDYALQAPDSVRSGAVQFAFENRGRVPHELAVGLLRPGAGMPEMLTAAQQGLRLRDAPGQYLEGAPFGVVFAWPGKTSPARLRVELQRGQRYALLCTLRDSATMPEHAALGMVRVLDVK